MSRASGAAALACGCSFAALAVLVGHGALTSIDQWAVRHAMPDAHFTKPTLADALVPLWGEWWHGGLAVATNLVTAPAGLLVATVVVAFACRKVRGRGAVTLAAAYVTADAIEEIVKSTLTRPALFAHGMHVVAFDDSYPSGHTIRIVLLVTAVAAAWPRLALPAAVWGVAGVSLLELGAWHVPSDIAGGLLLGAGLLATTWTSCFAPARQARSSRASRPSSRAR